MAAVSYTYRYAVLDELYRLRAARAAEERLSADEQGVYAQFRPGPRRDTWLLGRLLAKNLVRAQLVRQPVTGWGTGSFFGPFRAGECACPLAVDPARIEICSGPARGKGFRPRVAVDGRQQSWSLSIAHTEKAVLVVLAADRRAAVGADLVEPGRYGRGFLELWFTPLEQSRLRDAGCPGLTAAVWAAKEAVYKAVNRGEPFRPQTLEVLADPRRGLVCRPAGKRRRFPCDLIVWQTPQGGIAAIAVQTNGDLLSPFGDHHD